VLVGSLFPPGRPHQLVALREPDESLTAAIGKAMRESVDGIHAPRGRSVVRKAEHAEHAVNIHEQDGLQSRFTVP
jgi:hypothetical protein